MRTTFRNTSSSGRPGGIVGKLAGSAFFLVFLAIGLLFLGFMGWSAARVFATHGWASTPAHIVSSSVEKKGDDFAPAVRYDYEWNGRTFHGDTISRMAQSHDRYDAAQREANRFPAGLSTTCHVNPENPSEAVLVHATPWFAFFAILPLIFVVVGGAGLISVWRPSGPERRRPISSRTQSGRWIALALGGIFAAAGAAMMIFWMGPRLEQAFASSQWTPTPCTVISSRVKSHSSKDGTTYSVDVFYRYTVAGREYKSNRFDIFGGSSSGREGKERIVRQYPAGQVRTCYVNPAQPEEAVLQPGLGWKALLALIPLAFLLAGLAIMWMGIRAPSRRVAPSDDADATTWKSAGSPVGRLLGVVVFALVWNGITSFFVWQVIKSFQQGRPDWAHALFMVPFVLIGLGTLAAAGYFVLALFNPRCRLRIDAVGPPGGEIAVSWELRGAVHRLRRLTISLEGCEEAVYRRGTSTCTDRSLFARVPLTERDSWLEMREGSLRAQVPAGTMPSFAATNNRIVWSIRVTGEIKNWPDLHEDMPITIPHA